MPSPLIEVSAALQVIGQALDAYFNGLGQDAEPGQGSQAADERRTRIGSTERGTMFTAGWVWTTLGIPSDHLQAASRLFYRDQERASVHRFAVLSLLRVTLEVSALSWWLIRPGIGARQRMQQTLLHELWSFDQVERADKLLSKPDPNASAIRKMRSTRHAEIYDLAKKHNLQKIQSGSREIPKSSDLIGEQFEALSGLPGDARNIYARLSEVTHGNMLGTVSGYSRPSEPNQPASPAVPVWLICVGAQYAAFGFCHAVAAYLDFMGWDVEQWRLTTYRALKTLELIAHAANESADEKPTV